MKSVETAALRNCGSSRGLLSERMTQPLVSVVIPCYNRENFVGAAIASALRQSYHRKEIIVVDDGSTDASWSIISSFGDDIVAFKTENSGVSAARNRGIAAARGEFILFVDSDDCLEPEAILAYGDASETDSIEIRMGHRRLIDEGGRAIGTEDSSIAGFERGRVLHAADILSVWASNWACLIPKQLILAAGGYDERLSLGEDYDLNLRMLRCGARFRHIGETTYQLRVHGEQKLTRNAPAWRYEQMYHNFRAAWNAYEADFCKAGNRPQRVRLAQWVWSVARTCFRADFRDVGNRYIELATQIAGSEARHGSVPVLLAYRLFSPYPVERSLEFVKRFRPAQL